jgi:hypothetical protein
MLTRGNRLSNLCEHPFRQADATSAGHLLPEIGGLQKEEDAPGGFPALHVLMTLHPAAGRGTRMPRPIDNIRFVPISGMPEFDKEANH